MSIDINKVPDADVIAQRIFGVVNVGVIEQEMVTRILNDWNEEWIGVIAEQQTGMTDNSEQARKRNNEKRLRDRINRFNTLDSSPKHIMFDNTGF